MPEYIEREAAIRALTLHDCDSARAKMAICDIPSSDVAPARHGMWVDVREKRLFGEHYFLCSNCKTRNGSMIPFNYCPNCGAKMDGEADI